MMPGANEFDGMERNRATLRAAFAAAVLQGMVANPSVRVDDSAQRMDLIVRLADALIAALERPPKVVDVEPVARKPSPY
jgi:hypothetical protein